MCGIFGFTGKPHRHALENMGNAIVHRGPDDVGFMENNNVSLGIRRLSIVDLETGNQPVFNEDGSICVVFNGEVYNHLELRKDLIQKGHIFRSHHSDTEILVHAYEEYGDGFLDKLNGMFAIAMWDSKKHRILLARDRAGVKPLFVSTIQGQLIFASEIKSLLQHPVIRRDPDFQSLYHYFSLKNIPAPLTAYRDIKQLNPGEKLIFRDGKIERSFWWKMIFNENQALDEEDAAIHIRELLEDSVRLRMRSDVAFGAYLSGGVDSSSVVAMMSHLGSQRIKTFCLVYEDDFRNKSADRECAKMVSDMYGTEHYEHVLTWKEVYDSIDDVIHAFDEPFSGVTSTYFVTQLIAKHVKVALSGDGADELFGSYLPHRLAQPLYHFMSLENRLNDLAPDERLLLGPYADRIEYLKEICSKGDEVRRRASLTLWDDEAKKSLLSDKMLSLAGLGKTETLIRKVYDQAGTSDPLNRALYYDIKTLLPDQVLAFVDRLSMAHSVEVRTPFLDYRLIEYTSKIPGKLKIKEGSSKYILKKAIKGLLPEEILNRPKEGFVLPIDQWILKNMRGWVKEVLSPSHLAEHGLLRHESINKLLNEHFSSVANHGARIWNLVMFQLWWKSQFV